MVGKEKRYYWLKLKEDYFSNPKIKKLRSIAGGDTFTIIYLKMQLSSIAKQGILEFEKIDNTFAEEIALKIDEDADNVNIVLTYLQNQGLIEFSDNMENILFLEANNNIGSECESAERVRLFREREKALQCNNGVTKPLISNIYNLNSNIYSNIDNKENIEKEIYKEKENSCANAQKLATEVCNPTDLRSTNETTDTNLPYLQKEKDSKVIVDSKKQEVFDCLWTICMRKESKEQAKKTFAKLMKECKTEEEVKQKGRTIYQNYQIACKQWQEEQREKQYIPLLSTWLNDNVPEKMIKRR